LVGFQTPKRRNKRGEIWGRYWCKYKGKGVGWVLLPLPPKSFNGHIRKNRFCRKRYIKVCSPGRKNRPDGRRDRKGEEETCAHKLRES